MKKIWQTPELIVLVRGKPEEAVLTTCKGPNLTGPNNEFVQCMSSFTTVCDASCDSSATS